ncbi:hypothetical protein ACWG0P_00770 [Amedibacillus sp. YH-ame6]
MKKLISYMMSVVLLDSMTTVISAKGKEITPNHGWAYVYSWGDFNMTVGQTQFYILKRGSSIWSGDFVVLI